MKYFLKKEGFWILVGFVLARSPIYRGVSPFGVCAAAALGDEHPSAVLGVLVGCAFVSGVENKLMYLFCSILCFSVVYTVRLSHCVKALLTGALLLWGRGITLYLTGDLYIWPELIFVDALAGGLYTCVLDKLHSVYRQEGIFSQTFQGKSRLLCVGLCVLAFVPGVFYNRVPLSLAAGVLLTLYFCGSRAGASLMGACFGLCLTLMTGEAMYMVQLVFGAIAAETMAGKKQRAIAFGCAFLAGSVLFDVRNIAGCFIGMLAVLLYLCLPAVQGAFVFGEDSSAAKDTMLKNAAACLNFAAEIGHAVALQDPALHDSEGYQQAVEAVCKNCTDRDMCFGSQSQDTCDFLNKAYKSLRRGEVTFEPQFHCSKKLQMADMLQRVYTSRLHQRAAARVLLGVKEQCTAALTAVGGLLCAVAAGEAAVECKIQPRAASKAITCARRVGLHVNECTAQKSAGRGLEICLTVREVLSQAKVIQLAEKLENNFSLVFSAPEIIRTPGETKVHFAQKAPMSLSVAVQQTSCDTVSGDRFSHFSGADGYTYLLLCDGMGSGNRGAAFGSYAQSFLQKILQGGVPKQAGVDLLSSTMPFGCGMEGVCTIDLAGFNGFTGQLKLGKAGAMPCAVLSGQKLRFVGQPSSPVGICRVSLWEEEIWLQPEDLLVMFSDGIQNLKKVKGVLWQHQNNTPDQIARALLDLAEGRDDCTVVVARVERENVFAKNKSRA